MDRLGNLLPRILSRQPRAGLVVEYRLRLAFRDVLGETLAAACDLIEVHGSTLSITTSNPALAHQLRLDAEELIRRINDGSNLSRQVRAIRVRVGTGPGRDPG